MARLLAGPVYVEVEKIRNHLDILRGDSKVAHCLVLEELGHRGDALRSEDRKTGDRLEGRVDPHQSDVRAVKGGHYGRTLVAEHLLRDPRRRGVRNRVMNVDQVQIVGLRGVVQRDRQSQRVRGMLEEGIPLHLHFVEKDPFVEMTQAEGLGVRYEVDLVAPIGELDPQRRGHGSRPTVRRITRHADFHSLIHPSRGDPAIARSLGRQAATTSATWVSSGREVSMCIASSGSWFRNHVSCRRAYCRV